MQFKITMMKINDTEFKIIFSDEGDSWQHCSVSSEKRCPTWDEMCLVKDTFFEPEDLCIQMHSRKSQYINLHPYCLHMWKPPVSIAKLLEREQL